MLREILRVLGHEHENGVLDVLAYHPVIAAQRFVVSLYIAAAVVAPSRSMT